MCHTGVQTIIVTGISDKKDMFLFRKGNYHIVSSRQYKKIVFLLTLALVFFYLGRLSRNSTTKWRKETVYATGEGVKVILLTYMRSGSTFLGEIFAENPEALYWFEPLDGLYRSLYYTGVGVFPMDISHFRNGSERALPNFEQYAIRDTLLDLLHCDYHRVPVETIFQQRGFNDKKGYSQQSYNECLRNELKKTNIEGIHVDVLSLECQSLLKSPCTIDNFQVCRRIVEGLTSDPSTLYQLQNARFEIGAFINRSQCLQKLAIIQKRCSHVIEEQCKRARVNSLKVVRLTMDTVELLLNRDPSIKIIHLLRDPRGIVHSRETSVAHVGENVFNLLSKIDRPNPISVLATEATVLCEKMRNNISKMKLLSKQYPNNFLEVTYEDFAKTPMEKYLEIYDFLSLKRSEAIENWITLRVNSKVKREKAFETSRRNSTATAYRWRLDMDRETISQITNVCADVLEHLHYT